MVLRAAFLLCFLSVVFAEGFASNDCVQLESSRWCFSFHSELFSFESARSKCAEINSSLATIPNYIVNEFVQKFLNQVGFYKYNWHVCLNCISPLKREALVCELLSASFPIPPFFVQQSYNQVNASWIGLHWSYSVLRWTSGYPAIADTFWKESPRSLNGRCVTMSPGRFWFSTLSQFS